MTEGGSAAVAENAEAEGAVVTVGEGAVTTASSAASAEPELCRALVDTSVLAPEPLWLWLRAVRKRRSPDLDLLCTFGIKRELYSALRRICPDYEREQLNEAGRQRVLSMTPLSTTGVVEVRSPWVLDPGDVHLDAAAVVSGIDTIITDDAHAFAEHPERPYRVVTADDFLCEQTEEWAAADFAAALEHYEMHRAEAARKIGVEPSAGTASHLLRRSHARRFAKRVSRALRRSGP
jgi:predicted nucleic acid-binding protein